MLLVVPYYSKPDVFASLIIKIKTNKFPDFFPKKYKKETWAAFPLFGKLSTKKHEKLFISVNIMQQV